MVARGEVAGFLAGAERVGRRTRLLQRARPDRDGAVAEIPSLPAERLRLAPRLEDQLHPLVGLLAALGRVEVEAEVFIAGAAQQADHEPALRQGVDHRQFLGDADRVRLRHDRAQERDLEVLGLGRDIGGRDDRRGGEDARRIMVLREAHPVEADALDVFQPLDHRLIGLVASLGRVVRRRRRPFRRQRHRRLVAPGLEEREFHRRFLPNSSLRAERSNLVPGVLLPTRLPRRLRRLAMTAVLSGSVVRIVLARSAALAQAVGHRRALGL